MKSISTRMSENGRITFPVSLRAAVGLERGGDVIVEVVNGELHVRTVAQTMEHARAMARKLVAGKKASVDDFLADRRLEAKRER